MRSEYVLNYVESAYPSTTKRYHEEPATVYALVDPIDGLPRYIGVTLTERITERFQQHLREGKRGFMTPKAQWIAGLLDKGLKPIMVEIETVRYPVNVFYREMYWITSYLEQGIPLTNRELWLQRKRRKENGTMRVDDSDTIPLPKEG